MGENEPLYGPLFSRLGFGLFHGQGRNVALTVLMLAVLSGLGLAQLNRRLPAVGSWISLALILVSAGNLLAANWDSNWPSVDPTVPVTDRFARLLPVLEADSSREPMRFDVDGDLDVFSPDEAFRHNLQSIEGDLNIQIKRTYDLRQSQNWWRFWQLFNVRDIIAQRDLSTPGTAEVPEARDGDLRLFKILYPLPRAFVVHEAVQATSAADAMKRTLDDALDPGRTAVLEQPLALTPAPDASQSVSVSVINPQESRIDVDTSAAGLLLISEAYYPGWRAEIDGRPATLMRADYALEGLPVEAGRHTVTLSYDPASFKIGVALTLLSVVGLLVIATLGRRRNSS
jgi:hypothetical protein